MATQQSGEKHSRRKDSPYSLSDSTFSSDGSTTSGEKIDDCESTSTSSSSSDSSDDSTSSYEYKWEEAKPVKPPFQPFVTAVNIGTTELPALKREFCAVVPLKSVLVILFPNNTPGSLEEGIKRLDIYMLTKFEADLLTKYVQGLCDSGIHTFMVVDEIYVAEFSRGEVACSYESLQEKFTTIMKTLDNKQDVESDQEIDSQNDESHETSLQIYQAKKNFKSSSPNIGNLFLPISKFKMDDDGKPFEPLTIYSRDNCRIVLGTKSVPECSPARPSPKHCIAGEKVKDISISRDRKRSSSSTSISSSSDSSQQTSDDDAQLSKRILPVVFKEGNASKEGNVAVVLKHLFPENEEDDTEMEDDVHQESETDKKLSSQNLVEDCRKSQSPTDDSSIAQRNACKTPETLSLTENEVEHESMDTWTNMVSMEILKSKTEKVMKDDTTEKETTLCDTVDAKDNISDEMKVQSVNQDGNCANHLPRRTLKHASSNRPNKVPRVTRAGKNCEHDNVPPAPEVCDGKMDLRNLVEELRNAKDAEAGVKTQRAVMNSNVNVLFSVANTLDGINLPCEESVSNAAGSEFPTSVGSLLIPSDVPTTKLQLPAESSSAELFNALATELSSHEINSYGPNTEWKVTDSYSCGSPERRVQVESKKSSSTERDIGFKERGLRHKEPRTANDGDSRMKDRRRRSISPTRFQRREGERARDRRTSRSPVRNAIYNQCAKDGRPREDMKQSPSNCRNRSSCGHGRSSPVCHSGSSSGKATPNIRRWRVEDMYGGRGYRIGNYRPVQRIAKWVPNYSRLRFEYRPDLYSSFSSDPSFGSDDDDDDDYYAQMLKHKVLRKRSSRDEIRSRAKLQENAPTNLEFSNGSEKNSRVVREGRNTRDVKFPIRREASAESSESEVRFITVDAQKSVIPGLSMRKDDITNLVISIRKKCDNETNTQPLSSDAKSSHSFTSRRHRRSDSPSAHRFGRNEFRSPWFTTTKRRSHSPSCVRSFSPSPHRRSRNSCRRRSLSPISNRGTERSSTSAGKNFLERQSCAKIRDSDCGMRFDARNRFDRSRFACFGKAGNERDSLHHPEIPDSPAPNLFMPGIGDGSRCAVIGSADVNTEPMHHSRYSLPFSTSVYSSLNNVHCNSSLSRSHPGTQQSNAEVERIWTARERCVALRQYGALPGLKAPSDDEQVIFLKGEPDLESPTEDWPFFSSGSDRMSSVEDSCDGEVENLMFGKLAGLRKKNTTQTVRTEENLATRSEADSSASCHGDAVRAALTADTSVSPHQQKQLGTRKLKQSDVITRLSPRAGSRINSTNAGIVSVSPNSSLNAATESPCGTNVDAKCNLTADLVVAPLTDGPAVGETRSIAAVPQNSSSNFTKQGICGSAALDKKCSDKADFTTASPSTVRPVVQKSRGEYTAEGVKLREDFADIVECVTSTDSPCAYEEVVMQESVSKTGFSSDVVTKLKPDEISNAMVLQVSVDNAESLKKTDMQSVATSSIGADDHKTANVCEQMDCHAEMQVVEDAAVEQDGIVLGATVTIEGNQNAGRNVNGSSNAKAWKKKLLHKAQSNVSPPEPPPGLETSDVRDAQVTFNSSESSLDLNKKNMAVNETGRPRQSTVAELMSPTLATAMEKNMAIDKGADESSAIQIPIAFSSSPKGFELNLAEKGYNEFERARNINPVVLGGDTAQSCLELNGLDQTIPFREKIESLQPCGDQDNGLAFSKANDVKGNRSAGCVSESVSCLSKIVENGPEGSNMQKASTKATDGEGTGTRLEQKSYSGSTRDATNLESTVFSTRALCHVSSSEILSTTTLSEAASLVCGVAASTDDPSTSLAKSLIPQVTTVHLTTKTNPSSVIVPAIVSSIVVSTSTIFSAAATADYSLKDCTQHDSRLPVVAKSAVSVASIKCAEAKSTSSSPRPLLSSIFTNSEMASRSSPLIGRPSFTITVPANPVTAVVASAELLGACNLSTSVAKGPDATHTSVPATNVTKLSISSEALATASMLKMKADESSNAQEKQFLSSSRIFSNSVSSKTIINDLALKEVKSGGTLASRGTFRGPQTNHKTVQKLLSNRPGFISSRVSASSASNLLSHTSHAKLVSTSIKFPQAASNHSSRPTVNSHQSSLQNSSQTHFESIVQDSTNVEFVETDYPMHPTQLMNNSVGILQIGTQSTNSGLLEQQDVISTPSKKPLKSILRKPTRSFDRGPKHIGKRHKSNPSQTEPGSKSSAPASETSASVVESSGKIQKPEATFDERLHEGDVVIHDLSSLMKSRGKPGRKKKQGPSSKTSLTGRKMAKQITSSQKRGIKRTATRGRGRPRKRKRLPSISSDEDIIEELNAGAGHSLPKAKSQPSESESSGSEQEESDEDLVCFMDAPEGDENPAIKLDCSPRVVKQNILNNKNDNIVVDSGESIDDDLNEDSKPLIELVKRKKASPSKSSVSPLPVDGASNRSADDDGDDINIFTKMSREIEQESSDFANAFDRTVVDFYVGDDSSVRKESMSSAGYSEQQTKENIWPHEMDKSKELSFHKQENTEVEPEKSASSTIHHVSSRKTLNQAPQPATFCINVNNDEVQPILPTPPSSPKTEDCNRKFEATCGKSQPDSSQPGTSSDAPIATGSNDAPTAAESIDTLFAGGSDVVPIVTGSNHSATAAAGSNHSPFAAEGSDSSQCRTNVGATAEGPVTETLREDLDSVDLNTGNSTLPTSSTELKHRSGTEQPADIDLNVVDLNTKDTDSPNFSTELKHRSGTEQPADMDLNVVNLSTKDNDSPNSSTELKHRSGTEQPADIDLNVVDLSTKNIDSPNSSTELKHRSGTERPTDIETEIPLPSAISTSTMLDKEPNSSFDAKMTRNTIEPPVESEGPAESRDLSANYGTKDGIADLIAAAAEIAGVTSQSGALANTAVVADLANKPLQVVNQIPHLALELTDATLLQAQTTETAQRNKTAIRRVLNLFSECSVPDAESCHGFVEVSMLAPLNRTYASRRIPYVKTAAFGTIHAVSKSNSGSHGSASALSNSNRSFQGGEPILPQSAACFTYLRLRDLITLLRIHPECLYSLVTRCDATLYAPNEYARRLFAVVYDPACKADANLAKMTCLNKRGELLQDFLEHMVVLDKFLHSILPKFYAEALGVASADVPKFVNVKIFQPISEINGEVVKIFRKPYEYNAVLKTKDARVRCHAMQRRKFSVSSTDDRKRSHSSDSSGSLPRTPPTSRFGQQALLSSAAPMRYLQYRRPLAGVPLEQHPQRFYLTAGRAQELRTCEASHSYLTAARQHQLSARQPLHYGFGDRGRPPRPLSHNRRMALASSPRYGYPPDGSHMSVHPRPVVQQHSMASSPLRNVSSTQFVAAVPRPNVIRYTGIPNRYSTPNSNFMRKPPPYGANMINPSTTLDVLHSKSIREYTLPLLENTTVGITAQEKVPVVSANSFQRADAQEKHDSFSALVAEGRKAPAPEWVGLPDRFMTTKEFLRSASNMMHPKDEGKIDEVPTIQSHSALSGIDILAEAAAKVSADSFHALGKETKETPPQDFAPSAAGHESGHLSGVVGRLKFRVEDTDARGGKAKRGRKEPGSNRGKGRRGRPRGRAKR